MWTNMTWQLIIIIRLCFDSLFSFRLFGFFGCECMRWVHSLNRKFRLINYVELSAPTSTTSNDNNFPVAFRFIFEDFFFLSPSKWNRFVLVWYLAVQLSAKMSHAIKFIAMLVWNENGEKENWFEICWDDEKCAHSLWYFLRFCRVNVSSRHIFFSRLLTRSQHAWVSNAVTLFHTNKFNIGIRSHKTMSRFRKCIESELKCDFIQTFHISFCFTKLNDITMMHSKFVHPKKNQRREKREENNERKI